MTSFTLYTDGACRGNPGDGSCAWVLTRMVPPQTGGTDISMLPCNEEMSFSTSVYLGHCTNNIAEYCAVLYGLVSLMLSNVKAVTVVSDSELIVSQLTGRYQCNKPELNFYRVQILALVKYYFTLVVFEHRPRTDRFIIECDKLCNEKLDQVKKE